MTMAFLTIIMASCQSKEKRANELIKNYLSEELCHFESYEPIETIVTKINLSEYIDKEDLNEINATGWLIKHRFQGLSTRENPIVVDYLFVTDKDFKVVLECERLNIERL